ncbi:DUF5677 domain-containing protein [Blastococcus sp. TF02A-26]|uniref:DUF5677 domain-containing protein n=1 Tax=Blastococcus sp. TF02A-26 TaxID=2250577 RepID=UPI000DE825C0|nr:DUF5677 domain-containing protein [Blastococcus sp. TF02A-26]RBY88564.1 hypothetical protein DQ240_03870 [Blastococcus sp. TF02A-26]
MSDELDLNLAASLDRIDRLFVRWENRAPGDVALRLRPGKDARFGWTVWGLVSHVYAQAARIRPLLNQGEGIELAPVARSMFECALRAQWLVSRGPKALPGFLQAGARQRYNLGNSMLQAGWVGMTPEILERLQEQTPSAGDLAAQAKSFERMLDDFVAGKVLYTIYRLFSGMSHASIAIVDAYVHEDEASGAISLRSRADVQGAEATWSWTVVLSMLWAWAALDWITDKSPDRHFLKALSREVGTTPTLELTAEAARLAWLDEQNASRRPRTRG